MERMAYQSLTAGKKDIRPICADCSIAGISHRWPDVCVGIFFLAQLSLKNVYICVIKSEKNVFKMR
jgi:hypothetical protein